MGNEIRGINIILRERRPENAEWFMITDLSGNVIGEAGLAFYEKLGFKKEGIQEQGYYYNGEESYTSQVSPCRNLLFLKLSISI